MGRDRGKRTNKAYAQTFNGQELMQANHAEKKQTPHAVNAIYEDPEGYLYIGTIEEG